MGCVAAVARTSVCERVARVKSPKRRRSVTVRSALMFGVMFPKGIGHDDLDVLVLLQHRQQVVRRSLDHVDFARQESVDLGLAIGDPYPFDAIELGDLAAGQP